MSSHEGVMGLCWRWIICGLLLVVAAPAAATPVPFRGTLKLAIGPFEIPPIEGEGTAELEPDGSFRLPSLAFAPDWTVAEILIGPFEKDEMFGIFGFEPVFGPSAFGAVGGRFLGSMTLASSQETLDVTIADGAGGSENLSVPLGVFGVGGVDTVNDRISIIGSPWELVLDDRTPDGLGSMRFAATFTLFDDAGPLPDTHLGVLDLTVIPEPSSALLLALGLVALAAGRRPRRPRGSNQRENLSEIR
jgi:hypothetical protein